MLRGFKTIIFDMVPKVAVIIINRSISFKTIIFDMVPKGIHLL